VIAAASSSAYQRELGRLSSAAAIPAAPITPARWIDGPAPATGTLLGFDTPSTWAAINYQQETSLHNLWDGPTLIVLERMFMVLFGISVLVLMALANRFPRSAIAAIAPPGSLLGLALICAIPGAFIRLEVSELLLAIFFAFYSYRIHIAARSRVVTSEQSTAH
jgi:hypothetical protein